MKKLLSKFMTLFLVMFLLIQSASTVAIAQSPNYDERAVSAQGASIQETKIEPRTTEYLSNDSTTGELSLLRLETKASGEG